MNKKGLLRYRIDEKGSIERTAVIFLKACLNFILLKQKEKSKQALKVSLNELILLAMP